MLVYYQNLHDSLLILVILGNSRHIGWIEEQKKTLNIIAGLMNLCLV
jgi:hypothetical protein